MWQSVESCTVCSLLHLHLIAFLLINYSLGDQFIFQSDPVPDPVEDVRVPHQAVVPARDPVALVGEVQESRGYAQTLEDVEEGDAVGLDDAVVEVVCCALAQILHLNWKNMKVKGRRRKI